MMVARMKTKQIHSFCRRLLICLLVAVLSVCLLINGGMLKGFEADSAAIAIPIGIIIVIVCGLAAWGVTFASVNDAEIAAEQVWNELSSSTQKWLETECFKFFGGIGVAGTAIWSAWSNFDVAAFQWTAQAWQDFTRAIVGIWGQFFPTTIPVDLGSVDAMSMISSGTTFTFSLPVVDWHNELFYRFGGLDYMIYGCNSAVLPEYVRSYNPSFSSIENEAQNVVSYRFSDTGFELYALVSSKGSPGYTADTIFECYPFNNLTFPGFTINSGFVNISSTNLLSTGYMHASFYNGEKVFFTKMSGGYKVGTATIDNLFSDAGVLLGTDYVADKSICPDGLWNRVYDFSDWLAQLSLGVSIPGQIDVGAYPGVDTWPGEVTGDMTADDLQVFPDVSAWPGTIDITVPKDLTDTISIPTDIARDFPEEGTGEGETDKPKPTPPGGLPPLSIPEIIFKEKFPFCLPWDIYNLFAGFEAQAEAPRFEIPFKIDFYGLHLDEGLVIDLKQFDQIAKISRFFFAAAFVIFLILISRRIIGAE